MAGPLLPQDQADRALDLKLIRQDQYDTMFPKTTVEPPEEMPVEPMQQYPSPAGPYVAPDFVPYDNPILLSRMGEAMGYNPTATMGDLNPFGGSTPSPERIASAQKQQAAFMAPQEAAPIPLQADPMAELALDAETRRQNDLMSYAAKNYPGAAGYEAMRKGIEAQGAATREASRQQALEYQNVMDQYENYNKDQSLQDIAQNKRSEQGLADIEKMRTDLASQTIDPKRLFANAGTGEKILAWASLVLGGFGGGGRNSALDALNRAVDKDVEAQRANYQIKKEGLENKQTLYAQMMDKYKNERAAKEASKIGLLKMAELKLSQIASRYTDASTQGKVQEQLGKLNLLQDQAKADFMNALSGGDDPYKNMDPESAKRYVPGYGFAPDPDRAKLANAATTIADDTISNVNTILAKAKNAGRFDLGKNAEISQLVGLLRSSNREAVLGPGTVQEAERALLEELIQDPGKIFINREKAQRALEVIRDAAGRTRDNKLKSYGVRGRQERFRSLKYQ